MNNTGEVIEYKLTECDEVECGEKCHYASDIFLNDPMFNLLGSLLSYCFILRERDFL